ncbi:MAG TPA: hypothetical protein VNE61_09480 [Ktedonobacteraceae bacterium]|nr:hypothetical protein [Ktedonobacteraceae bacterium]
MIDTLMALWNRGYGGRGVVVAVAFFVICISISLLLITVQGPWAAPINRPKGTLSQRGPLGTASATPVRQTGGVQPVADNTVTIYAPTATTAAQPTSTAVSCVTNMVTGQTPTRPAYTPTPVIDHPTPIPTRPRPTPTATHTPPPTATPSPTITPTATSTPPPTPTATSTPTPSPTVTPSPSPTVTPSPSPTVTPTAVPSATVTAVSSPTSPIIPLAAKRTLCAHIDIGDSVGTSDVSSGAIIARALWLILGGSALGTTVFYLSVYWLARKKRG